MWYIYTKKYYTIIRKNEIIPFVATWMDYEIVIMSEVSQTEKEKYHMASLVSGIYKEMIQMNLKNRKAPRFTEQTYGCQGKGCGEGIDREFGMEVYTLL